MLFSAPQFFVFFAVYLGAHFLIPTRYRVPLIVLGGTVFYSYWNPVQVWLPYLLTFAAWAGVLYIVGVDCASERKRRLILVVSALLLPLLIVKYTDFFYQDVIGALFPVHREGLNIALPLGISFITFTVLAYVIDVYRGRFPAEPHFLNLLAYVTFFPHLIAGPILRPHELLPQLKRSHSARRARFTFGATVFSIGLVKKLVFADQIAASVDLVYENSVTVEALDYLLAIYGYSLQIYCDFSGYTDMAIGLAAMLGVRLPTNFRQPYTSASIVEFWRRWHITLSRWLRDYLYIPLGGNRRGQWQRICNILITMGVGGLWHGANWTFLVWGLLHGMAIVISHVSRAGYLPQIKTPKFFGMFVTFHLVTIAWVFFRAPDLETVGRVLSGPFSAGLTDASAFVTTNAFPLILMLIFGATHRFDHHARVAVFVKRSSKPLVYAAVLMMFTLSVVVSAGSSAKFIYFDF